MGGCLIKLPYGETFSTVMGITVTSFCATAPLGDDMSPGDLPHHPITLAVSGQGVPTNDDATKRLKSLAICGELVPMQMWFSDGSRFEAKFLIFIMQLIGNTHGEDVYSISVESSGDITPVS